MWASMNVPVVTSKAIYISLREVFGVNVNILFNL
jgi:hypothetical protein